MEIKLTSQPHHLVHYYNKGRSSKKSIPGIGKPSPSTMKKTPVPPKETSVSTGDEQEQPSTSIPAVPVL